MSATAPALAAKIPENLKRDVESFLNDRARALRLGRAEVVVHLAEMEHPPAPAWYIPGHDDAFVHPVAAGIDVTKVKSGTSKDHAKAMGLLAHELAHSKWSSWIDRKLQKRVRSAVFGVLEMFEELRVEQRAMNARECRAWLRASLKIITDASADAKPTTEYEVARMWALIFGRAITTVIAADEVKWIDIACRTALGDDDVDYLTDLLQEAIAVESPDRSASAVGRLISLAEEWLEIVGEPPPTMVVVKCAHAKEGEGEGEGGEGEGEGEEGTDGEGADGKGKGKSSKSDDGGDEKKDGKSGAGKAGKDKAEGDEADGKKDTLDLSKKPTDGGGHPGEDSGTFGRGEFDSEAAGDGDIDDAPDWRPVGGDVGDMITEAMNAVAEKVSDAWQREVVSMADALKTAKDVFQTNRESRVSETPPTPKHAIHVSRTAEALERMALPSITKVHVPSMTPPGRLRTREAVRGSAEQALGQLASARPWETTKRRHSTVRPVIVGIATDVSGSMRWAQDMVADFAYTWANAGMRIGARCASVTFGDSVEKIVGPGETLSKVRTRAANGGQEQCDRALAALDGALKLSSPNGAAKLLVIVSDAHFVISGETARVVERLKQFKAGGTHTLWVMPGYGIRDGVKDVATVVTVGKSTSVYGDMPEADELFELVQKLVLKRVTELAV